MLGPYLPVVLTDMHPHKQNQEMLVAFLSMRINGLLYSLGNPWFRRFAVEWVLEISARENLRILYICFLKEGGLTLSTESLHSFHLIFS